jgi:trk system potassium uptake protein TrkH
VREQAVALARQSRTLQSRTLVTPPTARARWARVEHAAPAALVAAAIVLGGADFVLAMSGWPSWALSAALSFACVAWALSLGPLRARGGASELRRVRLLTILRGVIVALALAFMAAKWLVLIRAGSDPRYAGAYRSYTAALVLLVVLAVAVREGRVARFVSASIDHPARVMAISFGLGAVLGALLLSLPLSLRSPADASLLDALFMSTSAICVTGLTTVNVAATYTWFGELVLCLLMQVGGIGIMGLSAAVTILAGRRLGLKSSSVLAQIVDAGSLADLRRTVLVMVGYTLAFEALGAAALYLQLRGMPQLEGRSAAWAAVFHSVSAVCNGSLTNLRDGLVPFAGAAGVCQTLALLIVLGGLGFPVVHELLFRARDRWRGRPQPRMSLNTRVALVTSAVLLVGMAVAYFALETQASFAPLDVGERINAALFQSACARTSGFNVVDVALMRPATLLLTCFAMFVGADPGSTAGGIKTTTLAVLFAAFRGELRGERPQLFGRSIPDGVVRRAMGVMFVSSAILGAVTFLLLLVERHDPLALFFEAVSAFSTTGLSTGITSSLTGAGKWVLVATMLVGRIGPLTVALALSAPARPRRYDLPEERVMIG